MHRNRPGQLRRRGRPTPGHAPGQAAGGQIQPQQWPLHGEVQRQPEQQRDHGQRPGCPECEARVVGGRGRGGRRAGGEHHQAEVVGRARTCRRGDLCPAGHGAPAAGGGAQQGSRGVGPTPRPVRRAGRRRGQTAVGGGPGRRATDCGGQRLAACVQHFGGASLAVRREGGERFGDHQQQLPVGPARGLVLVLVGIVLLRGQCDLREVQQLPGAARRHQPGRDRFGSGRRPGDVHPGQRHRLAPGRQQFAVALVEQRTAEGRLPGSGQRLERGRGGRCARRRVRVGRTAYRARLGVDRGAHRQRGVRGDLLLPVQHGLGDTRGVDAVEADHGQGGDHQQEYDE
ncbi:hypothetical protein SALBM311S_11328 [Streptomyces alboniger]